MELIRSKTTVFYNNNAILEWNSDFCIKENIPNSENIKITWDNISKVQNKYLDVPLFDIHNTRKGRKLTTTDYYFIMNKCTFTTIKEWKTPELNISFQVEYLPAKNVSINQILNYHDSEKAIKYLIEKGLTIIHN